MNRTAEMAKCVLDYCHNKGYQDSVPNEFHEVNHVRTNTRIPDTIPMKKSVMYYDISDMDQYLAIFAN